MDCTLSPKNIQQINIPTFDSYNTSYRVVCTQLHKNFRSFQFCLEFATEGCYPQKGVIPRKGPPFHANSLSHALRNFSSNQDFMGCTGDSYSYYICT